MDFEGGVLGFLEAVGNFDFKILIYFLIFTIIILWFFVVFWVWTDSRDRTRNMLFSLISVILVLPFNLFGLLIYLIIRPKDTIESLFWTDLERRYLIHETADLGDCNQCGYQMSPDFNACPQCAFPTRHPCPGCENMVRTDWKFCPTCSYQLLKRRAPEQEISQEVMEKNLEDTKVQAIEAMEKNRIRYRRRGSFLAMIGNSVIHFFANFAMKVKRGLYRLTNSLNVKTKKVKRRVQSQQDMNDNQQPKPNTKHKKKKKKKKRR